MNIDGSLQTRLTAEDINISPKWSPTGKEIAFASFRDDNLDICVMNSDGSVRKNMTHSTYSEMNPCWSPDGRSIAFSSNRSFPGTYKIFVTNLESFSTRELLSDSFGSINSVEDWRVLQDIE
jgi:TolB protein